VLDSGVKASTPNATGGTVPEDGASPEVRTSATRDRRAALWLAAVALGAAVLLAGCGHARDTLESVAERRPFTVPSASMEPTIKRDQRIWARPLTGAVERGMIVLSSSAKYPGELHVRRVVGLPGEVLFSRKGAVYVAGEALDELYLAPGTYTSAFGPLRLGANQYFLMGDARENSSDSRRQGPVPRSALTMVVETR
jgi:signal peptidase I